MTNKEKLNKVSNADAGELLEKNCYDNIISGSCCESCSECFTKWLSCEVKKR